MMHQTNNPVEELITETRAAFETETTVGRILERTKKSLERFLANPASLDHVKESLARVLARKSIPYGQPVDQDGYGSWRLYTDPNHLFCIRPTHQRSTTSRQPHDHGELGWAVYGILVGETVQQIYERIDDGSELGRAKLRPLPPVRQKAGEVIIIPVGAPHAIIARTENWSVVIRSREMENLWRNWYDADAGTVERKVFGYG
jgi:predicted metal-dependent enzyme (double-stranded beta helix superfamily)